MTRAFRIAMACLAVACHRPAPVTQDPPPVVVTRRQDPPVPPAVTRRADTVGVLDRETRGPRGLTFKTPDQRDSLRALLRRERELWRASAPQNYRFELNVSCFCPGVKGWLVMEVRSGQPLRAFDQAGKAVPITDWNTLSVDGLFDHLEAWTGRNGSVRVDFDPQWHFPAHINTAARPGPDMWGTYEARGFRPI